MMTREERALLLATSALALGRADPGVLTDEDKAFLSPFLGDNKDWPSIKEAMIPLIRKVAQSEE